MTQSDVTVLSHVATQIATVFAVGVQCGHINEQCCGLVFMNCVSAVVVTDLEECYGPMQHIWSFA